MITIVSSIVVYIMSFFLGAVSLEIRRLMILRGEKRFIVQDNSADSLWKAAKASRRGSWGLTALVILPALLGHSASNLISFATSGVVASTTYVEGDEINVLGLVGDGIADYQASFPAIDTITASIEANGSSAENMPLSLLSPELSLLGFSSSVWDFEITLYSSTTDPIGFSIYGNSYNTTEVLGEPANVTVGLCLEVSSISGGFSLAECREHIIVETIEKVFEILSLDFLGLSNGSCSTLYTSVALANHEADVIRRNMTFENGRQASAICASIFESIIESCVWKDSDILYFGDWNVPDAGECPQNSSEYSRYPSMNVLGVRYESAVENDTAVLLSVMTAEVFSGTGPLTSKQQLLEVLSAIVKLESVEWGVRTAYSPKAAVLIGISTWVAVMLILALLLPGIAWLAAKRHSGEHFFLPVSTSEWSACAAMELEAVGASSLTKPVKPLDVHYDQVYALRPATAERKTVSQRLGWVSKPICSVSVTFGDLPVFRSSACKHLGSYQPRMAKAGATNRSDFHATATTGNCDSYAEEIPQTRHPW